MFISESVRQEWTPRLLSVIRILVALFYLQHPLMKWFGFPGSAPQNMPFFPIILAGIIESFGSLLLLVGLYTRATGFVLSGQMAVAYFMIRPSRGFFPLTNGGETESLFCFVFFLFFLFGGGAWSLDALREKRSSRLATA
jgi:putative oxidoreductase